MCVKNLAECWVRGDVNLSPCTLLSWMLAREKAITGMADLAFLWPQTHEKIEIALILFLVPTCLDCSWCQQRCVSYSSEFMKTLPQFVSCLVPFIVGS